MWGGENNQLIEVKRKSSPEIPGLLFVFENCVGEKLDHPSNQHDDENPKGIENKRNSCKDGIGHVFRRMDKCCGEFIRQRSCSDDACKNRQDIAANKHGRETIKFPDHPPVEWVRGYVIDLFFK